jgi:hypothetical protein
MDAIPNTAIDKHRAYRRRLLAKGNHQIVVALPREIVALLDEVQQRQGLPNRSQAVLQLIEQGGTPPSSNSNQKHESPPCRAGFQNLVTGLEVTVGSHSPVLANRHRFCQRKLPFPLT